MSYELFQTEKSAELKHLFALQMRDLKVIIKSCYDFDGKIYIGKHTQLPFDM